MSTEKVFISYDHVHKLCQEAADIIKANFRPDLMVAIGGGGFIPARILRTFLKEPGQKNIPIQAIGLSLYEDLGVEEEDVETAGAQVIRTQWLDFGTMAQRSVELIGKTVLIVDEVDDTRTTLHYALSELEKDVKEQAEKLGRTEKTTFLIFVLHNKDKPKKADLPKEMMDEGRYIAARTVPDLWIAYPWESKDIETHTKNAKAQGNN